MAATAAATAAVAGVVGTAGAGAGAAARMQSVAAAGFPTMLPRAATQQQRAFRASSAALIPKLVPARFVNSPHSPSAMSSALHAVAPNSSENAASSSSSVASRAEEEGDKTNADEVEVEERQEASSSSVAQEWGNKAPERFKVRPGQLLNILGGSVGAALRFGTGAFVQGYKFRLVPANEFPGGRHSSFEVAGRKTLETGSPGPRPELPIELYEFEGCPFCRKVREIVSILDLDVLFYPTPKDGPNFRPKAIQMGGKSQFPYMVDPNTGISMYESDDIIKYLVEKYGDGKVPIALSLGPITAITAGFAMLARAGKGSVYTPSKLPAEPLKLWAYEVSPFCKVVREKLVELELPHYYYSTPRGSKKRDELFQRLGHFQVPYLEDPNTGVKMFESADIMDYLQQTYAIPASPKTA